MRPAASFPRTPSRLFFSVYLGSLWFPTFRNRETLHSQAQPYLSATQAVADAGGWAATGKVPWPENACLPYWQVWSEHPQNRPWVDLSCSWQLPSRSGQCGSPVPEVQHEGRRGTQDTQSGCLALNWLPPFRSGRLTCSLASTQHFRYGVCSNLKLKQILKV